jgi:hypothetical protein
VARVFSVYGLTCQRSSRGKEHEDRLLGVHIELQTASEAAFSVWTEFMVRVKVRVRVAARSGCCLQCLDGSLQCQPVSGVNTREVCHWPHTPSLHQAEQAWEPMASSSVNFCRKTRTVPTSLCAQISRPFTVPTVV